MTDRTRRAVLAGAGAGLAALAGCSGGDDGGAPTATQRPPGVRLMHVDLMNRRDEPQTVHLQVERDDEVVYWAVHDLGTPGSGGGDPASVQVVPTWPDTPATYTVEARVGDGPVRTATYGPGDGDCIGVFAPLSGERLEFYTGDVDCGDGTATPTER